MFENRRVYLLTGVAYMGAMLFGSFTPHETGATKASKESPTDEHV